jgi:hypothetical protein
MSKISIRSRLAWFGASPSTGGTTRRTRLAIIGVCIAAIAGLMAITAGGALAASADTLSVDFESYTPGTIHDQDGWSSSGPYDHEVDAATAKPDGFGDKSLRISNAVVSGSFSDQTFSSSLLNEAGESSAENGDKSGGDRQSYFESEFEFTSTTAEPQEGAYLTVSPDRGDGARMSWVKIKDTDTGLALEFSEYKNGGWVYTPLASNLNRTQVHTLKLTMQFVDGPANDIVNVFVDGAPVHTGTSWEEYFRTVEHNETRTVDSLLFRTGSNSPTTDARPGLDGKGFLIDNLTLTSGPAPSGPAACTFTTSETTMTLNANCTATAPIVVPGGYTLDGNDKTITVPAGTLFNGGVIENTPGQTMNVQNVTIEARDLATSCGVALHAIKLVGAGGSITNNTIKSLYQLEGTEISGCQNGRAIYANSGAPVTVTIAGNTVLDYQKSGIEARGAVTATIVNNVVDGWGAASFATNKIASNGVLVAFGASALVKDNKIKNNWYTPTSDTACGLLLYEAGGVSASKPGMSSIKKDNVITDNETDICNVGKGGNFKP